MAMEQSPQGLLVGSSNRPQTIGVLLAPEKPKLELPAMIILCCV